MKLQRNARLVTVMCLLLLPATAWAQGSGNASIAGVVKDATGAVMAGVTVEAASPALIEKARTVVTDESGKTYNTAVSFVDVGSTPEFACAIPFRVPTGTMLKSLQIDAATLEIPAGKP